MDFVLARSAMQCGIRSKAYFHTFVLASMQIDNQAARQIPLTAADKDEVDRHYQEIDRQTVAKWTCHSLLNSAEMDRLDEEEFRLKGGYH